MPRVYQTPLMGQAHLTACIVHQREMADVLVYRATSWGRATAPAFWFFTRDKQQADVYLYLGSIGMADLRVCFVREMGEAGWRDVHHPLAVRHFGAPGRSAN